MPVTSVPSSIVRASRRPEADVVLIVLPHAGAGASVCRKVAVALRSAEVWGIQLPGRENRLAEPACTDMRTLVDALSDELTAHLGRPFAVYGHSLGAAIGFELCLSLANRGLAPEFFFPAASRAPAAWQWPEGLRADLDGGDLIRLARRVGGISEAVLADEQFRDIVLRALRADLTLGYAYQPNPADRLSCPVTAFYGTADPTIREEASSHWADSTTGPFSMRAIQGGHLFLVENPDSLAMAVQEAMSR